MTKRCLMALADRLAVLHPKKTLALLHGAVLPERCYSFADVLDPAKRLQLAPEECLMVACYPLDLDAAAKVRFRTALILRPTEWGVHAEGLPEIPLSGTYDVEVDSVLELDASLLESS